MSRFTVDQVLGGPRAVSAEMALRLEHVLDTSPELWLKLQAQVDRFEARRAAGTEFAKLPSFCGWSVERISTPRPKDHVVLHAAAPCDASSASRNAPEALKIYANHRSKLDSSDRRA